MPELVNVFIPKVSENKFLAVRRSSLDKHFGDMHALPGGGVEPGETHIIAARREFLEETGVKLSAISQLPIITSSLDVFGQQAKLFVYEGSITSEDFHPQDTDISQVVWVDPDEFIKSLIKSGYPKSEIPKFKQFLMRRGFNIM